MTGSTERSNDGDEAPGGADPAGLDGYVPVGGPSDPVSPQTGLWVAALLALAVLLGVGAVAVARQGTGSDSADRAPRVIQPASPIDGKASKRHPVRVTPDTGLVDGQQVTVSGSEFPPNEDVGVVMCTNAAATRGVDACDISTSSYLNGNKVRTSSEGTFEMTYTVRSHFRIKDPNAPAPVAPDPGQMVCTSDGVTETCSAPGTTAPPSFPAVPTTVPLVPSPGPGAAPAGSGEVGNCAIDGDGVEVCSATATTMAAGPFVDPGTVEVDCLTGNVEPAAWAAKVAAEGSQATATGYPDAFTCMIAVGVISDYDQSGAWPVAFEGETFTFTTTTTAPAPPEASTTTAVVASSTTTAVAQSSTTIAGPSTMVPTTLPLGPTTTPVTAIPVPTPPPTSSMPGCPGPGDPPPTTIRAECR